MNSNILNFNMVKEISPFLVLMSNILEKFVGDKDPIQILLKELIEIMMKKPKKSSKKSNDSLKDFENILNKNSSSSNSFIGSTTNNSRVIKETFKKIEHFFEKNTSSSDIGDPTIDPSDDEREEALALIKILEIHNP
jgi:hypothetical protein